MYKLLINKYKLCYVSIHLENYINVHNVEIILFNLKHASYIFKRHGYEREILPEYFFCTATHIKR